MITAAEARNNFAKPTEELERIDRLIKMASPCRKYTWARIDPRNADAIKDRYHTLGFTVVIDGEDALISW